eukprot:TRINITY_DN3694_c0_g1_i1.p1 TRINITY_DN3694_c0_g1~~TRINITY_DN3694_c0_g1_i1.p1  ORF type:complete len:674 (-),score=150.88 TRINITY_DN3694_c0_g1_i1:359-2278(-)
MRMILSVIALAGLLPGGWACTNFLVTPGASADASSMIGYNADSHLLYGSLVRYPRATHAPGTMRKVFDWESGQFLGEIPEAPVTYNVIGNTNEFAVTVGETTFGGRPELSHQPGAKIDYGSLISITLQRSRNASEAIDVMTSLVEQFGYASEGESFSIGDPSSVWILEMIGRGPNRTGAVWAAVQLPDGTIAGHANQARITSLSDLRHLGAVAVRSSPDMVSFAVEMGWYPKDAPVSAFSFRDAYDPISFTGARFCEARVWAGFTHALARINPQAARTFQARYTAYVSGLNMTDRMPLWISADAYTIEQQEAAAHRHHHATGGARFGMTMNMTVELMGLHFAGTPLAFDNDVSAGPFALPYRWRPLTWAADPSAHPKGAAVRGGNASRATGVRTGQQTYFNERSQGTQQTGWSFVSQMRGRFAYADRDAAMSKAGCGRGATSLGSVLWFATDDSSTSVYVPFFGNISAVPPAYSNDTSTSPLMTYDPTQAFWIFNLVSNWAYTRWRDMYPIVAARRAQWHAQLVDAVTDLEARLCPLQSSDEVALATTEFARMQAAAVTADWRSLFGELFTRFMDGNVKRRIPGAFLPSLDQPGYGAAWYDMTARETGDRYLMPSSSVPAGLTQSSAETAKIRALRKYL